MNASSTGFDPIARRRNLVAVIVAMSAGSMTYGMSVPLLSLVLDAQEVPSWLIGLSAATQAVAVFPIAPAISRALRAWGPAWLMLLVLFGMAALYILLVAFPNIWAWFPLRFLLGAAGSAFWIVGEAWINQVAAERSRGRVLSLSSMAVAGGFAAGPFVLARFGSEGWLPFLFLSGATLATMLPVAMALGVAPSLKGKSSSGIAVFFVGFRGLKRKPLRNLYNGCAYLRQWTAGGCVQRVGERLDDRGATGNRTGTVSRHSPLERTSQILRSFFEPRSTRHQQIASYRGWNSP